MKKNRLVFLGRFFLIVAFPVVLFAGCAEIQPTTPNEFLERPLGKGPLRVGMTKEEVIHIWGQPDVVNKITEDGVAKEEWIYEARYPGVIPADVGYATKSKYLVFDGENLVRFHD